MAQRWGVFEAKLGSEAFISALWRMWCAWAQGANPSGTALKNSRSMTWLLLTTENRVGGPERKEFELKPTFPLRLFLRMPRPPQCISASPRKRFTSTNSGSLNTLALVDPLIVGEGPEGSSNSLQWWRRGESNEASH